MPLPIQNITDSSILPKPQPAGQSPISQKVIIELGLDKLPPEQQAEAMETIGRIIFTSVMDEALDILNEEDKKQLDALLTRGTENGEEVWKFLQAKIPDIDTIVADSVEDFRKEANAFASEVK